MKRFELLTGAAGLVTICASVRGWEIAVHLLVRPSFWLLGYEESWWDGPLYLFGLGPLVLVTAVER